MDTFFIIFSIMFFFWFSFIAIQPLTILVHELGHAIPSLIFTKGEVKIFIGSNGDPNKGIVIKIFRLKIYFKYNLTLWNQGLCVPGNNKIGINQNILITLMGPLVSIIFGVFVCYYCFENYDDGRIKFLGLIIFSSSILDFYFNIKPNPEPFKLFDGNLIYNDGQQLLQLFKYKFLPKEHKQANEFYTDGKYLEAVKLYVNLLENGNRDKDVFHLAINSFIMIHDFQSAQQMYFNFGDNFTMDADCLSNIGLAFSKLEDGEASMDFYNRALELNPQHIYALNNRGFQNHINQEYEKAIDDFNQVIELEEDVSYALSNRGHSKLELGLEEEGLKDIMESLKIDDKNSYAYRNLGIYFMNKNDKLNALKNFKISFELDPKTHYIEELIQKIEDEN